MIELSNDVLAVLCIVMSFLLIINYIQKTKSGVIVNQKPPGSPPCSRPKSPKAGPSKKHDLRRSLTHTNEKPTTPRPRAEEDEIDNTELIKHYQSKTAKQILRMLGKNCFPGSDYRDIIDYEDISKAIQERYGV